MHFNEGFTSFFWKEFRKHYNLDFDLTSIQDAAEQLRYTEIGSIFSFQILV